MSELFIPGLAVAARRLRLDAMTEAAIAESVLCRLDAGLKEGEATTMALRDYLQRRGLYEGALKQAVEDGTIFSIEDGEHDGRRNREDSRRTSTRGPRRPA